MQQPQFFIAISAAVCQLKQAVYRRFLGKNGGRKTGNTEQEEVLFHLNAGIARKETEQSVIKL
ncbi:MAG: hypothetical protein KDC61_20935, partial [Saprospiraceae bacterium]|nr:hypothetical protein [Saprospiraceae bacterium]